MALHLLPRSLHYVETVANLGSIQAASREIGIAASAIDRQILMLEEAAQVQLFERQPGGMRPTPAGEAFIVVARRWRGDVDRLWSEVRQMHGVEMGNVRLAAMDSQANGVLPALVSRLGRDHPRIRLAIEVLSPGAAVRALEDGAADLALAFNVRPQRDLHVLWSADLPFGCVVAPGHPLAAQAEATLRDAARHPIAAQSRTLAVREYLDRRHAWLFAGGEPALVTNSLQLLKQVLTEGRLIALTSELDAAQELMDGSLCFVPIRDRALAPQTIGVLVSARRSLPRVARLTADLLAEIAARFLDEARAATRRRLVGKDRAAASGQGAD